MPTRRLLHPNRPLTAILSLFTALTLAISGHARADQPLPPAQETALLVKLQKTIAAHPFIKSDFHEERISPLLNKPLLSDGTVAFHAPNQFRREVKGQNPSLTVSDGKVMWIYYPKFQTAELYPIGKQALFDDAIKALIAGFDLSQTQKFYHVTAYTDGSETHLHLTPKQSTTKRVMQSLDIWLNADCEAVKSDYVAPKGDRIITTYTHSSRATLPASLFEFTPPAGVQVTHPLGK